MSATAYLITGGALVASAFLYKHAAGIQASPEEKAPTSSRGESRPSDDPWKSSFTHLHPLIDTHGAPVSVTADTRAKERRQLVVGGTILPRRVIDSQRGMNLT